MMTALHTPKSGGCSKTRCLAVIWILPSILFAPIVVVVRFKYSRPVPPGCDWALKYTALPLFACNGALSLYIAKRSRRVPNVARGFCGNVKRKRNHISLADQLLRFVAEIVDGL